MPVAASDAPSPEHRAAVRECVQPDGQVQTVTSLKDMLPPGVPSGFAVSAIPGRARISVLKQFKSIDALAHIHTRGGSTTFSGFLSETH